MNKGGHEMPGYLIKDTTEEERRKIVEDSLGYIDATCDGCLQRTVDMYDASIRGEKELRDINMEYNSHYIRGDMDKQERRSCPM